MSIARERETIAMLKSVAPRSGLLKSWKLWAGRKGRAAAKQRQATAVDALRLLLILTAKR